MLAGVVQRQAQEEAAQAVAEAQRRLQRRSRFRLVATSATVVVLVVAVVLAVLAGRGGGPLTVTLFYHGAGEVSELMEAGFVRATSEFGLVGSQVLVDPSAEAELDEISDAGEDLIVVAALETDVAAVAREHPDTRYVTVDLPGGGDNVESLQFAANEGSYLAGAAAALRSTTGIIGFVGGVDVDDDLALPGRVRGGRASRSTRQSRSASAISPSRRSTARATSIRAGVSKQRASCTPSGADVVFAAAGTSGVGVFEAAVDMSAETGTQLWAIGVDSDQYETVADLPGSVGASGLAQPHPDLGRETVRHRRLRRRRRRCPRRVRTRGPPSRPGRTRCRHLVQRGLPR